MRRPNAIETKDSLNCATCDCQSQCKWCEGIRESNRSEWICEHYANEAKGYYLDSMRLKKVKK